MAAREEILMIRPLFRFSMSLTAGWETAKCPLRWTAMIESQTSSVVSTVEMALKLPAQLTTISTFPKLEVAALMMLAPPCMVATLSKLATAAPPAFLISLTTLLASSRLISLITILAPAAAISRAMPRPKPSPPPVTTATLPFNAGVISSSS